MELAKRKCSELTNPSLIQGNDLIEFMNELGGDWKIINEHHLEKSFTFKDFKEALDFVNKVGKLAEEESHHPDLHLSWGKVRIVLWSHKQNGLCETDFILAAKIDLL